MKLETNLRGRLRSTKLPQSKGLFPLFEAIINSIHGLEAGGTLPDEGLIRVTIEREGTPLFDEPSDASETNSSEPIVGFKVIDNGIGFNNENFQSFITLDTQYKIDKGGRGIGRLLWLKAFDKVDVVSHFLNDQDACEQRSFRFSPEGISDHRIKDTDDQVNRNTSIYLRGFKDRFRSNTPKKTSAIARSIVEYCLWYFVRPGGAPRIMLVDQREEISLNDLYESITHTSAYFDQIQIKDIQFDLLHVKLRSTTTAIHSIGYCADDRLVEKENLNKYIPGLHGRITNGEEFVYMCYVSSSLLNERVDPVRNTFDISSNSGGLFDDTEISWSEISQEVVAKISDHLREYIDKINQDVQERINEFVSKKAPRYRPILQHLNIEELNIDPEGSDKDLELILHRQYAEMESQFLTEGHDLMKPQNGESLKDYHDRISSYLRKVEDVKKYDLANYVTHRRVVIDLLKNAIKHRPDGSYVHEEMIHKLMMPMQIESSEVLQDYCNLWLIDERLAFHEYLASDKTLSSMPITGSKSMKEPDLLALNVFDNPMIVSDRPTPPLASIVIVEIKRPMRNDATQGREKDPIEQALIYLKETREGGVQTIQGRQIPASDNIPGFCYVICDITPTIVQRCNILDLSRTRDGMGYFGYNKHFQAYIEVISFDRLVNMAMERNRAFFDKLGLPAS